MDLFLPLSTAFIISFVTIKLIKPLACKHDLVDKPNERKHHTGTVPLIGGIATFIGVMVSVMLWLPSSTALNLYVIASAMMVFIGVLDDKHELSVRVRLVGQVIIASLMIFGAGYYLSNLGNLFGFGDLELSWFGIIVTYIAVVGAINAFNMVDGIDGLVGALAINTFTALAILFLISGESGVSSYYFPLIIVMAILPYLLFNLGLPGNRLQKIFMGDAGSMFIGLSVVWLLAIGSQGESATFRPVTALWLIAIPLMDMASIMFRRLKKGKSPFLPDRDHLHHIFLRAGFSSRRALVMITLLAVFFSAIGIVGEYLQLPEWLMFVGFLITFAVYNQAIIHIWRIVRFIRENITAQN